jgi:hypothetical protein
MNFILEGTLLIIGEGLSITLLWVHQHIYIQ